MGWVRGVGHMILCDAQPAQQTRQVGFAAKWKAPRAALFLLSLIAAGPALADRQQDPQLGALLEQGPAAGGRLGGKAGRRAPLPAARQQDPQRGAGLGQALAAGACFEEKLDEQVGFAAMEPKLKPLL